MLLLLLTSPMPIEVKVPSVGESITSGILGVWNKPDGAYVKAGEPIFEIETDKVTSEVVAESAGQLKHLVKAGDTVQIGQVVASIDEKAPAPARSRLAESTQAAKKEANGATAKPSRVEASAPVAAAAARGKNADDLSPAVRYQTEEKGIDPASIQGTGKEGRILKGDVLGRRAEGESCCRRRRQAAPISPRSEAGRRRADLAPEDVAAAPEDRRAAAQRAAGNGAPDHLQRSRSLQHHGAADQVPGPLRQEARGQARLHVVLREGGRPRAPRRARDQLAPRRRGSRRRTISTTSACAISTDKGLLVPVLRDADQLSFAGVEKAIAAYAKKARDGKITLPGPRRRRLHHHQRRRLRLAPFHADPQPAPVRHPRHAHHPGTARWPSAAASKSAP